MCPIIPEPAARDLRHRLRKRRRGSGHISPAHDLIAAPDREPQARQTEDDQREERRHHAHPPGPLVQATVGLDRSIDRAVTDQHGQAHHPAEECERIQQLGQTVAGIDDPYVIRLLERHPDEQVADRAGKYMGQRGVTLPRL